MEKTSKSAQNENSSGSHSVHYHPVFSTFIFCTLLFKSRMLNQNKDSIYSLMIQTDGIHLKYIRRDNSTKERNSTETHNIFTAPQDFRGCLSQPPHHRLRNGGQSALTMTQKIRTQKYCSLTLLEKHQVKYTHKKNAS